MPIALLIPLYILWAGVVIAGLGLTICAFREARRYPGDTFGAVILSGLGVLFAALTIMAALAPWWMPLMEDK
jgi:ribulose 1,5-bisphosphate synthetase/thiazole synthase